MKRYYIALIFLGLKFCPYVDKDINNVKEQS